MQTDDCLDVVCLREQVEACDRSEGVAAGDEFPEIAGEGRGVAGDVGDVLWMEIEDAFDYC